MRILVNPLILFQTTPAGVVAEPNQITFAIGHLSRDADLVAVEVVDLLAPPPSSLMWFRQAKPPACVPQYPTSGLEVSYGIRFARPDLRLLLVLHKLMSNIKRLNS